MALPNTDVKRGDSGIGTPLPGKDHICGLATWRDISGAAGLSDPLGASGGSFIKKYGSIQELESDGVKSNTTEYKDIHYQVSEFFRLNPQGELWLGVFDATAPNAASTPYSELETMQNQANGEIRVFGVYAVSAGTSSTSLAFATSELNDIQSVLDTLRTNHMDATALAAHDHSGVAAGDMTTLSDLTSLSTPAEGVSAVISQDQSGTGANLFSSLSYSITDLGAKLGAVSAAKVSTSIAYLNQFNMTDGTELDVPGFANGDANTKYTESELDSLNDKHYIFLRKFVGVNGTFNSDSWTAAPETNDFATIENNRTIDKAIRDVRTKVVPFTNGPIQTEADTGKLSKDTIDILRNLAEQALDPMVENEEISPDENGNLPEGSIQINPDQDVVANSKITMGIKLVPIGVARTIEVTIGFTTKV